MIMAWYHSWVTGQTPCQRVAIPAEDQRYVFMDEDNKITRHIHPIEDEL